MVEVGQLGDNELVDETIQPLKQPSERKLVDETRQSKSKQPSELRQSSERVSRQPSAQKSRPLSELV